jgi:TolA-binding protein
VTRGWEKRPELEADDRRARELPFAAPDAARVDRVRQRVLAETVAASAPSRRPARRKIVVALLALGGAAAASVAVLHHRPGSAIAPPAHNAVIQSSRGARFAWVTARPDEVVRLHEGSISVDITPLGPDERFRVLAADGEVEARAGHLEIAVAEDRLARVTASEPGAVVLAGEAAPVRLDRGASWSAPQEEPPAPAPVAVAPAPAPVAVAPAPQRAAPRLRHKDAPRPEEPAPGEASFRGGWNRFRQGEFADAARAFASACREAGATALSDDACFWHGAAWERAGRPHEAEVALRSYLERHGRAPRAGEAHAMLGWILLRSQRPDEAEGHFRAAIADPAAPVRASATRGLEALGSK